MEKKKEKTNFVVLRWKPLFLTFFSYFEDSDAQEEPLVASEETAEETEEPTSRQVSQAGETTTSDVIIINVLKFLNNVTCLF